MCLVSFSGTYVPVWQTVSLTVLLVGSLPLLLVLSPAVCTHGSEESLSVHGSSLGYRLFSDSSSGWLSGYTHLCLMISGTVSNVLFCWSFLWLFGPLSQQCFCCEVVCIVCVSDVVLAEW